MARQQLKGAQVAHIVREARKMLGITQREAAARVGVSHRLWAEFERGERPNVSLETALRMLSFMRINVRLTYSPEVVKEQSHMLDDVDRILSLSPEDRLREVAATSRFLTAAHRV